MAVHDWSEEFDVPFSEEALRDHLESLGYSVTRYVYPPGTHFPDHTHRVDKIDAVVSGRFRMTMHGESVVLEAGQWIEVPHGAAHEGEVVGEENVVSLDAVRRRS